MGSNPGRRGGKPAVNRLSYGTASMELLLKASQYKLLSQLDQINDTPPTPSKATTALSLTLKKVIWLLNRRLEELRFDSR
jgi:hypothetical protein